MKTRQMRYGLLCSFFLPFGMQKVYDRLHHIDKIPFAVFSLAVIPRTSNRLHGFIDRYLLVHLETEHIYG